MDNYSFMILINNISNICGKISNYLITVLGLIIVYEIIMRYFFDSPTIWVHDMSQYLFGIVYMLGGSYALKNKAHVNMDMIYNIMSNKIKNLLNIFNDIIMLTFLFVLVWWAAKGAIMSIKYMEILTVSAFEPPLYPMKIIFFFGCFFMFLQGCVQLLIDIKYFINKNNS